MRVIEGGGLALAFMLVALVVASSGCSSNAGPGTEVGPSHAVVSAPASVEPSASATYKPPSAGGPAENVPMPAMPEEAKVESKEGLIAFAQHWYALANYGYQTGDVEPLREISGPDCYACKSYYKTVASGFREGWVSGAEIEILDVSSTYALTDNGRYQVLIQIVQEPLDFYTAANGFIKTVPGNDLPSVQMIEATFASRSWTAVDVVTIYHAG